MADEANELRWKEFETLGPEEVRKRLGAHHYGEDKERLAREWLEHQESLASIKSRERTMALAREANDLARSANTSASEANAIARNAADSAAESARALRTNNIIATLALIAAVIAMALSIIGLFLKR
jgi:hypothetical protein